ncbi:glycosyltransferase family 4 protein [Niallia sp. 03133]|uniref:glycosyltransferase family 4 protein n=1 Tax=Niallia sp. 03133 TaxID=3458060 RepID=UPI0040449296
MKILLATYWIVPHVGGVWNYMNQLKDKLETFGHEVDLLGYGDLHKFVYAVSDEVRIDKEEVMPEVTKILEQNSSIPYYADPVVKFCETQRLVYELGASKLNLKKYDLIHTQDVFSSSIFGRIKPKDTTLVATLHGSVAHEMKDYVMNVHVTPTSPLACTYFDELEYIGATSAVTTIVANNWLKNILINEFNVPAYQLTVLHYGYDTETFLSKINPRDTSIQKPPQKKVILFTGRLVALKGVHHLINALSKLRFSRNDWICWIVGEGEKQRELEQQTKELGLEDHIHFFGKRSNIPQLLYHADIFVLPSLIENQPLSLIEAQIVGKPIIVSDAGGIPEMVQHGINGMVTKAGDERDLCNTLYAILENEEFGNKLGGNAKKWALEHWSLEKGATSVLSIYNEAINIK